MLRVHATVPLPVPLDVVSVVQLFRLAALQVLLAAPSPVSVTAALVPAAALPKRFHGTASLDSKRVGRDAGRIADEVVAHLAGLVGANVKVTLEIEAEIPTGAPDHVVRTVTENCRTLKFDSQGFEKE